jgi:hypothetical protein
MMGAAVSRMGAGSFAMGAAVGTMGAAVGTTGGGSFAMGAADGTMGARVGTIGTGSFTMGAAAGTMGAQVGTIGAGVVGVLHVVVEVVSAQTMEDGRTAGAMYSVVSRRGNGNKDACCFQGKDVGIKAIVSAKALKW